MQLLALGAPRDLLAAATQAMADETQHAELCFGLASAFAGYPIGPGPLPVRGAIARVDLEQTVRDTFLEGCIGETLAVLEAAEALEQVEDKTVREVLAQIVEDESRHAALAWRFVAWALAQRPELGRLVAALLDDQAAARPRLTEQPTARGFRRAGLLDPSDRLRVRQRALVEVVRPCVEALLGAAPCLQDTGVVAA